MKKIILSLMLIFSVGLMFGCGSKPAEKPTDKPAQDNASTITKLESVNTEQVLNGIGKTDVVIVDTRNDSLYNGFKDKDAKRGGHIKGAIQFTSDWLGKIEDSKFDKFAEEKGITKDKTVIIYDTNSESLSKVYKAFKDKGYNVKIYVDFVKYTMDEKNPMESLPKFDLVVSPTWVKDVMDGKKPETYTNDKYMIFEVSWGDAKDAKDYNAGHINGAYHFNTDWIEEGPLWNLSSPEKIEKNLLNAGITSDKTIILYSKDQSAGARVMFALKWAGVKDVRYLNGGIDAWKSKGYETQTGVVDLKPETAFGVKIPANPSIDIPLAKDAEAKMKDGLKLVSIRSWEEYTGKVSGYDYIPRKGEPKGAIYGFAGSDAQSMQDYYDPDGTLRNPYEILKLWDKQGIKQGEKVAFYCGTGWRAAVPWIMTQMMDWKDAVIYDGGWNSWQMDPNLPVQEGAPNNQQKPNSQNDYK